MPLFENMLHGYQFGVGVYHEVLFGIVCSRKMQNFNKAIPEVLTAVPDAPLLGSSGMHSLGSLDHRTLLVDLARYQLQSL